MAKFKLGDRVVVVKKNPHSGLDESHFIGEAGEVVAVCGSDYVSIMFDNHSLEGLWSVIYQGQSQSTVVFVLTA